MKNQKFADLNISSGHSLPLVLVALWTVFQPGISLAQPAVRADPGAPNAWKYTAGAKFTDIGYRKSISRSSASDLGLLFDADNAQRGGVGLGTSRSTVKYNNGTPTLNQTNYNFSGRLYGRDNITGGKLIYRLDHLRADNNDSTRLTDDVRVWAPKLGYLNSKGTLHVDLEYAHSKYNQGLKVRQYTPTLGFGLNDGFDWLSFRPTFVRLNDATRAMNKRSTNGLEGTWTHYLSQSNEWWKPASFSLGGFVGNRIYAVDTNTGGVTNLAHIGKTGGNVGLNFKVAREVNLGLYSGMQKYVEPTATGAQNSYRNIYTNLTLTANF
jgi:hypothetical protein